MPYDKDNTSVYHCTFYFTHMTMAMQRHFTAVLLYDNLLTSDHAD